MREWEWGWQTWWKRLVEEIVGNFSTQTGVTRNGKGVVILLRRSLRPSEIWNNLWSSIDQPQGFSCLPPPHPQIFTCNLENQEFISARQLLDHCLLSWAISVQQEVCSHRTRKRRVAMTPTYLSSDTAGREWGSLHCLGVDKNMLRLGKVFRTGLCHRPYRGGLREVWKCLPCDITSSFPPGNWLGGFWADP